MNKQSQWLFEAPFVSEIDHCAYSYFNPEYYRDSEVIKPRPSKRNPEQARPGNKGKRKKPEPCLKDDMGQLFKVPLNLKADFEDFLKDFQAQAKTSLDKEQIANLRQVFRVRLCEITSQLPPALVNANFYFTAQGKRVCRVEVTRLDRTSTSSCQSLL